jgi:hypothetical protein
MAWYSASGAAETGAMRRDRQDRNSPATRLNDPRRDCHPPISGDAALEMARQRYHAKFARCLSADRRRQSIRARQTPFGVDRHSFIPVSERGLLLRPR